MRAIIICFLMITIVALVSPCKATDILYNKERQKILNLHILSRIKEPTSLAYRFETKNQFPDKESFKYEMSKNYREIRICDTGYNSMDGKILVNIMGKNYAIIEFETNYR